MYAYINIDIVGMKLKDYDCFVWCQTSTKYMYSSSFPEGINKIPNDAYAIDWENNEPGPDWDAFRI